MMLVMTEELVESMVVLNHCEATDMRLNLPKNSEISQPSS